MTSTLDATGPPAARPDPEGLDRLRILLAGAMGSVIVSYALLVPAAAAAVLTGGAGVSVDGAFAAAIPLWLAAHRIPLVLGGQPLGVLPLLPTVAVAAMIAVAAGWTTRRLGGRARTDAGPVLVATAGGHATVAVLGSALLPRSAEVAAAPWAALVASGLLAGAAAAIGVGRVCGVPDEWTARAPAWAGDAVRLAAVAVTALAGVGALVLTAGLVLAAPAIGAAYADLAPGFGAGVGVTLLAVSYLPNAVAAGLAWALGPGFAVGSATVSPFGVTVGEPSVFPLLAALPGGAPSPWTPLVLLAPVAVGVLVGSQARWTGPDAVRVAGAAVALAAVAVGLVALLAGGRLAAGPYDPVALPAALLVPVVLLLVGVPAVLLARLGTPREDAYEYEDEIVPGGDADIDDHDQDAPDPVRSGAGAPSADGGDRVEDGTDAPSVDGDGRVAVGPVGTGVGAPSAGPVADGDGQDGVGESGPAASSADGGDQDAVGPGGTGVGALPAGPATDGDGHDGVGESGPAAPGAVVVGSFAHGQVAVGPVGTGAGAPSADAAADGDDQHAVRPVESGRGAPSAADRSAGSDAAGADDRPVGSEEDGIRPGPGGSGAGPDGAEEIWTRPGSGAGADGAEEVGTRPGTGAGADGPATRTGRDRSVRAERGGGPGRGRARRWGRRSPEPAPEPAPGPPAGATPRTVAELVALRAREAAEREAAGKQPPPV